MCHMICLYQVLSSVVVFCNTASLQNTLEYPTVTFSLGGSKKNEEPLGTGESRYFFLCLYNIISMSGDSVECKTEKLTALQVRVTVLHYLQHQNNKTHSKSYKLKELVISS